MSGRAHRTIGKPFLADRQRKLENTTSTSSQSALRPLAPSQAPSTEPIFVSQHSNAEDVADDRTIGTMIASAGSTHVIQSRNFIERRGKGRRDRNRS